MSDKPSVKLVGQDGNAFMVLGLCKQAARKSGMDKEQVDTIMEEMMAGDYDHVLQTAMKHFDVS